MRNPCKISVTDDGVLVHVPATRRLFRKALPKQIEVIRWSEVTKVFMFKRDCFSVDMICMVLELDGAQTFEINEEMIGWKELVDAIPLRLPGAMKEEEWFQKVALPPFATCWTKIYPR